MTEAQQVDEWLHCWRMLMGDEGRISLMAHLKKKSDTGDKIAHEALGKIIKLWFH